MKFYMTILMVWTVICLLAHGPTYSAERTATVVEPAFTPQALSDGLVISTPEAEGLEERTIPVEVNGRRYEVKAWVPAAAAPVPGGCGQHQPSTSPSPTLATRPGLQLQENRD